MADDARDAAPRRDRRPARARRAGPSATASSRSSSTRSSQKQREIIVKDQLDQIYTANGGEFLNAFTTEDQTAYFVRRPEQPAGAVGLARVGPPAEPGLPRVLLRARRGVRGAADADGVDAARQVRRGVQRALLGGAAPTTGRSWAGPPTSRRTRSHQAKDYFATYYAPNNLTGVLVGDFRIAEVKPLLERYFGRIPRGKTDPPPVVTLEPKQLGEKRFNAAAETSPTVRIWWKTRAVRAQGHARPRPPLRRPLRPHRAGSTRAWCWAGRSPTRRTASIDIAQVRRHLRGRDAWSRTARSPRPWRRPSYEEIEKLQKEPVPAEELQKVKNAFKANAYRRLSSPFAVVHAARGLRRASATGGSSTTRPSWRTR